jgi:hypothetical protein
MNESKSTIHTVCHHCGEKGHIRPKCPKYLDDIESGKIIPANLKDSKRKKNPPRALAGPNCGVGQSRMKDPKVKAFLSAFQALSQVKTITTTRKIMVMFTVTMSRTRRMMVTTMMMTFMVFSR